MAIRVISAAPKCPTCQGPLNVGCGKDRSNCYCELEHDYPGDNCWMCPGRPEQYSFQVAPCFRLASTADPTLHVAPSPESVSGEEEALPAGVIKPESPRINVVASKSGSCPKYKQNRRGRPSNDVPCLQCGKLVKEH